MSWLKQFWRDLWTSKEMVLLRAEVDRLRETNAVLEEELFAARGEIRGLVNSALSQAGVTPLPAVNEEPPRPFHRIRRLTIHQRRTLDIAREERERADRMRAVKGA